MQSWPHIYIYILQKEKVKVYIDEKYHHATDPSIRPPKQKHPSNDLNIEFEATSHPTTSAAAANENQVTTNPRQTPKTEIQNTNKAAVANQRTPASMGAGAGGPAGRSGPNSRTSTLTRVNANTDDTYGKDIRDIPKSTWKLLTNKIYIVTCLVRWQDLSNPQ